jgi:hypothetical protein
MIDHYLEIPIDFSFPLKFADKGVFHIEQYDRGESFLIYRHQQSDNFHVFDIKLIGANPDVPDTW